MINGFEEQTAPLTDAELARVNDLVRDLKLATGSESALTNRDLRIRYRDLSDSRVRKIINHIRQNDLVPCLIASSKGYYVAQSEEELKEYEESLNKRAVAIWEVRNAIKRQREAKYNIPSQGVLF